MHFILLKYSVWLQVKLSCSDYPWSIFSKVTCSQLSLSRNFSIVNLLKSYLLKNKSVGFTKSAWLKLKIDVRKEQKADCTAQETGATILCVMNSVSQRNLLMIYKFWFERHELKHVLPLWTQNPSNMSHSVSPVSSLSVCYKV